MSLALAIPFGDPSSESGPQKLVFDASRAPESLLAISEALDTHARVQAMADAATQDPNSRQNRSKKRWNGKPRRVRVENERGPIAIAAAIPDGYMPARHVIRWLRYLEALPQFQTARKDLKKNIWAFANAFVQGRGYDPVSKTHMPVWERLSEQSGIPLRSLSRYFRRLRDWNLLGLVATGRSAEKTPRSTGKTKNEAAIYVLLEPLKSAEERRLEKSGAPVPKGYVFNPTHTHENQKTKLENATATPFASLRRAASRLAVNNLLRTRKEPFWPGNATTNHPMTRGERREAERLASAELQYRIFPIRNISTAHLASIIRPFLQAGWTVNDVAHAIDNPFEAGTRHGHDGATGITEIGHWLTYRLGFWIRTNGVPHRSPTQTRQAQAVHDRAQARAENERRQKRLSQRGHLTTGTSWRERFATEYANGLSQSQGQKA